MSSKLIFKNGKSKTAAIVLSSVSFALSFVALTVYFTGNFFAVWLALPLVFGILAGFVLTICAVAVNPKTAYRSKRRNDVKPLFAAVRRIVAGV